MKKILLTAAAIAAIAAPALTLAQGYPAPAGPDKHDVRQDERHDVKQDVKQDVRHDVKQDGRQDVHQDIHRDRVFDRNDHFWWRGRPEFTGYGGPRPGFWFIPGRGYIQPPPRWYGFNWVIGAVVPFEFRGYGIPNPYIYNLPPAPPAYTYVYLGRNIALIARDSGRIIHVYPNVYF